jgi:putative flippase GtrA
LLKETLQLTPSRKLSVQFLRSIIVSIIALVFDFGLLVFFKQELGIYYLLAATLSFLVGVIVNYLLSVYWVFAEHKLSSRRSELIIFVLINAVGLGLNLIIISSMVDLLGADYRAAKAVSTVVVFFWNFIIRKKILY